MLKFKLWDRINHRWVEASNAFSLLKAKHVDNIISLECDMRRYVMVLFTGFKDKNGIEIYDRDILVSNSDRIREVVKLDTDLNRWMVDNGINPWDQLALYASNLSVLGSSFEFPLEVSKD